MLEVSAKETPLGWVPVIVIGKETWHYSGLSSEKAEAERIAQGVADVAMVKLRGYIGSRGFGK